MRPHWSFKFGLHVRGRGKTRFASYLPTGLMDFHAVFCKMFCADGRIHLLYWFYIRSTASSS